MEETILVVDDEKSVLNLLKRILNKKGYNNVILSDSAEDALDILGKENVSVVLTDVRMPGIDGITLLDRIKEIDDSIIVIIVTAFGSIDQAVECMKKGAHDFITKPFSSDIIILSIEKALKNRRLNREVHDLRISVSKQADFMDFVGVSEPMQEVYNKISTVASTDAPAFITGESGTGKELAARAVHNLSTRRDKSLVSVSCPNIPVQMLESELFGYVKGAFTDAYKDKKGLFEKADCGTIFLDEIGDITPDVQVKLLRVLQEGDILPLGSEKVKKLDVRVITSTNKNIHDRLKEGSFREDLFYRINVINIHMPPLRERKNDIRRLSVYFSNEYAAKVSKSINGLTEAALRYLEGRRWDGNVRELKNAIYQGVVFSKGDFLDIGDFTMGEDKSVSAKKETGNTTGISLKESRENLLKEFEMDFMKKVLSNSGGNISKAAAECGLSRQSFQYLMKKYGIKIEK